MAEYVAVTGPRDGVIAVGGSPSVAYTPITLLDEELPTRMMFGAMLALTRVFMVAVRERKIIETGT